MYLEVDRDPSKARWERTSSRVIRNSISNAKSASFFSSLGKRRSKQNDRDDRVLFQGSALKNSIEDKVKIESKAITRTLRLKTPERTVAVQGARSIRGLTLEQLQIVEYREISFARDQKLRGTNLSCEISIYRNF